MVTKFQQRGSLALRATIGITASVACFSLGAFLHFRLELPADLGIFDYLLPWAPILICFAYLPRGPKTWSANIGHLPARIIWSVAAGLLAMLLSYLLVASVAGSGAFI